MRIPFFTEIKSSHNVLLAGAGGGFDIANGIPLYTYLKAQGKNVILANLSFTELSKSGGTEVCPETYEVTLQSQSLSYFPEKYILEWLHHEHSDSPKMYAFGHELGVAPLRHAYQYLIKKHQIDTVILIDGGTDGLMFGDEASVGSIIEDACSILAVAKAGAIKNYVMSVGFGIEHDLNHYACLENIATLTQCGAYKGTLSLSRDMPEGQAFLSLTEWLNQKMPKRQSIVINAVANAMQGQYGDQHVISRTEGTEQQYINPLMPLLWFFQLEEIATRIGFAEDVQDSQDIYDVINAYQHYRSKIVARPNKFILLP